MESLHYPLPPVREGEKEGGWKGGEGEIQQGSEEGKEGGREGGRKSGQTEGGREGGRGGRGKSFSNGTERKLSVRGKGEISDLSLLNKISPRTRY